MYANVNGIRGKMASLQTAVDTAKCHIVTIAETKGPPPKLNGYATWYSKSRTGRDGGGVAIAAREDIANSVQIVDELEDHDQEIIWVQINTSKHKKIHVGIYYGKQEKEPIDTVEREFSQLKTQIIKLKKIGTVLLTGDFNAKSASTKTRSTRTHPVTEGYWKSSWKTYT